MVQKPIRILIAITEPATREFLHSILEKHQDVEIVGEALHGLDLLEKRVRLQPHAIFVDTEMPKLDGLSAVKMMADRNEHLAIIFVTEQRKFAVQAFDLLCFDYILKPLREDRVVKTLNKIRNHMARRDQDLKRLSDLLKSTDKLYIKDGHELVFINTASIYFVEKSSKKTLIHTVDAEYETHESINDLEQRLTPSNFFRSHKCYLINLKMVESILPWGDSNSYMIKFFDCDKDASLSRAKTKMLYELLGVPSD